MRLQIEVEAPGAERAARAVTAAGDAVDRVGRSAASAAPIFSRLDGAVDRVEKPMRALNGALDILTVGLGVGLAGPLGAVVGQLVDLGRAALDAVTPLLSGRDAAAELASGLDAIGRSARYADERLASMLTRMSRGGLTGAEAAQSARAAIDIAAAEADLTALRAELASLAAREREVRSRIEGEPEERRALTKAGRFRAAADLVLSLPALQAELERTQAMLAGTASTYDATTARLEQLRAAEARMLDALPPTPPTPPPTPPKPVTRARAVAADEADGSQWAARIAELRGFGAEVISRTRAQAEAEQQAARGRAAGADGLFPLAADVSADLSAAMEDVALAFESAEGRSVVSLSGIIDSMRDLRDEALDMGSVVTGAMRGYSEAVGGYLARMIAGAGEPKSLRRYLGDITLALAQQAAANSIYLAGLGTAAALTGFGAFGPAQSLFAGSAVMAATAVSLGLAARALGTTSGASRGMSGSGSGGGGDRVASISRGPTGRDQPLHVTVVLGIEEVHGALVSTARRVERAGGLSGSRLAVA